MKQGDFEKSSASAAITLSGEVKIGGQEHMYLEGQVALAIPEEEDRISIYTSSQHPSEVQKLVDCCVVVLFVYHPEDLLREKK